MEFLILWLFALAIYFLPLVIALSRGHPQWGPILVINLFLGWSLIGWVVALAWSVRSTEKGEAGGGAAQPVQNVYVQPAEKSEAGGEGAPQPESPQDDKPAGTDIKREPTD